MTLVRVGSTEGHPAYLNCGQVAIANLTGVDLLTVEQMIGHDERTLTVHIAEVLNELGWKCPDKLIANIPPPQYGIAKVVEAWRRSTAKKYWHWMAVVEHELVNGYSVSMDTYRVTSYLPVEKPEGATWPKSEAAGLVLSAV